ncbi:MAG: hypothetical protein HY787_01170 [Deltaproteobacteria bacterium]|nr:hypothetical protein [Deltaproteobacteria bacterium]
MVERFGKSHYFTGQRKWVSTSATTTLPSPATASTTSTTLPAATLPSPCLTFTRFAAAQGAGDRLQD